MTTTVTELDRFSGQVHTEYRFHVDVKTEAEKVAAADLSKHRLVSRVEWTEQNGYVRRMSAGQQSQCDSRAVALYCAL